MYLDPLPIDPYTTTLVRIKYDCCEREHILKWKDANKNYTKNNAKHICHQCWITSDPPVRRPEAKEKMKATNIKKYGNACSMNTPELIEARRQQFNDPEYVAHRNEARKNTCLEKYGVEFTGAAPEVIEKRKQTMIERYGVDNALQAPELKAKQQATNLEKYGNICPLHGPDQKEMVKATNLERYGVDNYSKLPEFKAFLREHCREWLKDSWANPYNKGRKRLEEWNRKQRETVARKMQEGTWNGGYVSNMRGRYPATKCKKQMPRFLSSLELIFHYYLNNSESIEWYDYEALIIPYKKDDGTEHFYFPDFLVKEVGNDILTIFETKCHKENNDAVVLAKQDAAIKYANENNMIYVILFDEDIKQLNINLSEVQLIPEIEWQQKR